jgi:hypothetical protein
MLKLPGNTKANLITGLENNIIKKQRIKENNMDIINTIWLINKCYDTVYESDDPVQRRYSLLTLHFMAVAGIELSEDVVDTAEKLLKNDPSWNVRRHAAWVINNLGTKHSIKILSDAMADKNLNVKFEVLESLAAFASKHDDALEALLKALNDKNTSIKLRALYHLTHLKRARLDPEIANFVPEWYSPPFL